jgi:hypothetical protein
MRIGVCVVVTALVCACGGSPAAPGHAPVVREIQPAELAVGDTAVLTGTGFAATGNGIHLGPGYLNGVPSSDGTSLRFVLPTALSACPPDTQVCIALAVLVTPGTYRVSIINANGTSNEISLRIVPG